MVEIKTYKKGLCFSEIWFPTEHWKETDCDIADLRGGGEYLDSTRYMQQQRTLITDLTQSMEDLWAGITSKTFKYDIRRSSKDPVSVSRFHSSDLQNDEQILHAFMQCYEQMYREKGMSSRLDKETLQNYIKADALILTVAFCEDAPIVFHSYVDGKDAARLWHSCSNFRSEKEMANVIARANKRLHVEDWQYLKSKGYRTYDWGGVVSFEDTGNGIDAFKRAFGGTPHIYYNGRKAVTFKGKWAFWH